MTRTKTPLPVLLAHVLLKLEKDYQNARQEVPPLPFLLNLLRVLNGNGVRTKDLPQLARLSIRAARMATQIAEKRDWVRVEKAAGGGRLIRLTSRGETLNRAGLKRLKATETSWRSRYGDENLNALRTHAADLVAQLDLEYPHYPSGYGLEDNSVHGGNFTAGEDGPPRIPSHGAEWSVVIRDSEDSVSGLSTAALLSQLLCAYTIDYDGTAESSVAGLNTVLGVLRHVPDEGLTLPAAKALAGIKGTGRTLLERHQLVHVKDGIAMLTGHGKRVRDRYPGRVIQIENAWRKQFGRQATLSLRRELEAMDARIDSRQPDLVDVCGWLHHRAS
ncbi:MAG: hypothetical protein AAF515_13450 [Pseudomonadota bacterium]